VVPKIAEDWFLLEVRCGANDDGWLVPAEPLDSANDRESDAGPKVEAAKPVFCVVSPTAALSREANHD
jgi:hypothetical protein